MLCKCMLATAWRYCRGRRGWKPSPVKAAVRMTGTWRLCICYSMPGVNSRLTVSAFGHMPEPTATAPSICSPPRMHIPPLRLHAESGETIQTALDSRLAAPSASRVSSAASAAISQRIAIAPQPSPGQEAESVTASASTSADDNGSHSSSATSSSAGRWRFRRQHTQSQLLLPLLRARKAVRRVIQQAVSWHRWRLRGVVQRKLSELDPVRLPNQTNRLALAFSPLQSPPSSFCCGLEVFQPSHVTMPHVHNGAWELFFIISGARSFLQGARSGADCIAGGAHHVYCAGGQSSSVMTFHERSRLWRQDPAAGSVKRSGFMSRQATSWLFRPGAFTASTTPTTHPCIPLR